MSTSFAVVVDADSVSQKMVSRVLARAGITPAGASTPAAAANLLAQLSGKVQLVFIAPAVPLCDAVALATAARDNAPGAAVLVASDDPAVRAACGSLDASGVFLLPSAYSVREVARAVQRALESGRTAPRASRGDLSMD
ncbi:MAG TPA: hypothetical protein VF006_13450 [Longimicrobium sp.]